VLTPDSKLGQVLRLNIVEPLLYNSSHCFITNLTYLVYVFVGFIPFLGACVFFINHALFNLNLPEVSQDQLSLILQVNVLLEICLDPDYLHEELLDVRAYLSSVNLLF
jgi:hypothetical protein